MTISDKARKIPGAAAKGAVTGAIATEQGLPIADYDKQTAEDIAGRQNGLSQRELRMVDAYEPSTRTARRSPTRSRSSPAKPRSRHPPQGADLRARS